MSLYGHPARVLLALVALGGIAYWGSLDNSFQYDDFHSVVENPHIRDLRNLPAFFSNALLFSAEPDKAMYRPVLLCSYALNHALGGYRVLGYHLVNLGLHLLNAWLVYWLGRALCGPRAGWLAALLFLVHPLAAEPVNYISSRSESLATLFYLVCLNWYLRGRRVPALGACALGLLTKSTLVTLPALLVCWELWGGRSGGEAWTRRARRVVPFLLLSLGYLVAVRSLVLRAYGAEQVRGAAAQLLTQLKALVYYLKLLLLPSPLSVEHAFRVSAGVEWVHLPAAVFLVSLTVLAARSRSRWGLLFLAAALLPLLPASLVPLNVLVNEHRLYLPLAFGALGLGALLDRSILLERPVGVVLLVGVLCVWAGWSGLRTRDWQDELTLWTRARETAPEMPRVHFALGDAHRRRGELTAAVQAYRRADRLYARDARGKAGGDGVDNRRVGDEGNFEVQLNLGGAYIELGDAAAARAVLEPLARRHPGNPRALYNLGLAVREVDAAKAMECFRRAFELDPAFHRAGMELGMSYEAAGQLAAARQTLEAVVQRAPRQVDAWVNLGWVRARMEDFGDARAAWEQAVRLDPEHHEARANLEELGRLGR